MSELVVQTLSYQLSWHATALQQDEQIPVVELSEEDIQARRIQAVWRGYAVRKKLKQLKTVPYPTQVAYNHAFRVFLEEQRFISWCCKRCERTVRSVSSCLNEVVNNYLSHLRALNRLLTQWKANNSSQESTDGTAFPNVRLHVDASCDNASAFPGIRFHNVASPETKVKKKRVREKFHKITQQRDRPPPQLLSEEEIRIVFSNVESIAKIHNDFLRELEDAWSNFWPFLTSCTLTLTSFFTQMEVFPQYFQTRMASKEKLRFAELANSPLKRWIQRVSNTRRKSLCFSECIFTTVDDDAKY